MCFFKGGNGFASRLGLNVLGGRSEQPLVAGSNVLIAVVTSEERAHSVGLLLLILVLLLHLWATLALLKPGEQSVRIKPVTIEVSLLAVSAPENKVPAPAPAKPKLIPKPVKPQSPPVKPPPKKKTTVIRKQAVLPRPVVAEAKPAPLPFVAEANVSNKTVAPVVTKAVAPLNKTPPKAAPAAQANEHATCVVCPKMRYPVIAQRRGWEGGVLLRLQLSADGRADNVTVLRSSGHEALDEAAIANAKESRFTASSAGVIRLATKLFEFKLDK